MDLISTIQYPESDDVESAIFWRTVRSNEHALPECDLMLAVLKDALLNFRKNLHNPNKLFKADRAWFFQNDREDLYSFESICAVLGLSAHGIRRRLQALGDRSRKQALHRCPLNRVAQVSNYCSQYAPRT